MALTGPVADMNPNTAETPPAAPVRPRFRWLLPAAVVVVLAQLSVARDAFAVFSRPVVIGLINLCGGQAVDHGATITVGRLEVPWSADCAGLNLLVLLLAVAVWMNRQEPMGGRYWLRILLMIPAAALANVMRIFMILAYREAFYPEIESPQLHYFFGLVLLVPFSLLAMPGGDRPLFARVFELLHVASVIGLLTPNAIGAEGAALSVAVVLGLSSCRVPARLSRARLAALGLWILGGGLIAFAGMESFWLPWLLLCPLVCDADWVLSLPGLLVVFASHRLVFLLPGGGWAVWAALAYAAWVKFGAEDSRGAAEPDTTAWSLGARGLLALTAALFLVPFLSSTLLAGKKEDWTPPADAFVHPIPAGKMVALPGQPPGLGLVWYDAQGTDRHHKLAICLKYRGIELAPAGEAPGVFTDGTHWMKEFFLQGEKLHLSHRDYVLATLGPGSSPGVHLIVLGKTSSLDASVFSPQADALARRLYDSIRSEQAAAPGLRGTDAAAPAPRRP